MLFKKKEKFRAFKVYILNRDQKSIDRPKLVSLILDLFETNLETPIDFDIGGPYGIRKGASCGIKAFRKKLEHKGHDKYYALSGITENRLGFEFLVDAVYNEHCYSELIVWFNPQEFSLSFEMLIRKLLLGCKISYAYEIELNEGLSIRSETKIKKGIFGGLSVQNSFEHLKWMDGFNDGAYREIFSSNLMNDSQLAKAREVSTDLRVKEIEDMHFVEIGA